MEERLGFCNRLWQSLNGNGFAPLLLVEKLRMFLVGFNFVWMDREKGGMDDMERLSSLKREEIHTFLKDWKVCNKHHDIIFKHTYNSLL